MTRCDTILLMLPDCERLTPAEELKVRTHVSQCASCHSEWLQFKRMHRALRALNAPAARPPQRVEQALQPLFHNQAADARPRQWRTGLSTLALGIVLLAIILGRGQAQPSAAPDDAAGGLAPSRAAVQLFMESQHKLAQIDPATLADLPNAATLELGARAVVAHSPTSGLLAVAAYEQCDLPSCGSIVAQEATIYVRDMRTGKQLARFRPPGIPVQSGLSFSHDGSRLILPTADELNDEPIGWLIFDPYSGQLIDQIRIDGGAFQGLRVCCTYTAVDAERKRAYVLTTPNPDQRSHPVLYAFDASGKEIGRLELSDVLVHPPEVGPGASTSAQPVAPGIAYSPDGRYLAALQGDGSTLTLVDLPRLVVLSTRPVARDRGLPASPVDEVAGRYIWLVQFSHDGAHLYASGWHLETQAQEQESRTPIGLRLIDIEDARITAEALSGEVVVVQTQTPDNRTIYVRGRGNNPADSIYRLDAETLTVQAERDLARTLGPGLSPRIFAFPAAAGAASPAAPPQATATPMP